MVSLQYILPFTKYNFSISIVFLQARSVLCWRPTRPIPSRIIACQMLLIQLGQHLMVLFTWLWLRKPIFLPHQFLLLFRVSRGRCRANHGSGSALASVGRRHQFVLLIHEDARMLVLKGDKYTFSLLRYQTGNNFLRNILS